MSLPLTVCEMILSKLRCKALIPVCGILGLLVCPAAIQAGPSGARLLVSLTFQNAAGNQATVKALINMAEGQIEAGNAEEGKTLLQQALMLDPQNKAAKEALAELAAAGVDISGGPALALAETKASMTASELLDVARAQMRDGDYPGAQATLEAALQAGPSDREAKQIRSFLTAIAKEQQKAAGAARAQMDHNLSELDKQINKAMIYMENGQYEKAEIELHQAKLLAPNDQRVDALLAQAAGASAQAGVDAAAGADDRQRMMELKQTADAIFEQGVDLYKQGLIIEAVEKWNMALEVFPGHQSAETYITNTRVEYEQAVMARQEQERMAAEEARYEKMLDTTIRQYSTQGDHIDIKDVLRTLSAFTDLNIVMDENLAGNVAFELKNTTLREILNLLQKQYGFVWRREGNSVFVEPGFQTRVFTLDEGQYKTLKAVLEDPSSLEDSSRNLKVILYGPQQEFNVPGKNLYLNPATQALVVTDSEENLRKVEAFLKEMPRIVGEDKPVQTEVYKLGEDVAKELYEIVRVALYEDQGSYDVRDNRRKLFLEQTSSSLIVIDYPENIQKVERILSDPELTRKVEEGDLEARQFPITDPEDLDETPEALARREEFVNMIADVLRAMLYGKEGVEAAALQGRQLFVNPDRGTIDVVDTPDNLRRVDNYLNSIRGETTQDILIERFSIQHVNVFDIADALGFLFFDSQQSTRTTFLSQTAIQTLGTDQQGTTQDVSNIFEETSRDRFNLTGGGGGGTDLLQFFSIRFYPEINTNSIVAFTTDQEVLDLVARVITTFDVPQRMVELEQRIVTVSLEDMRSINFDYLLTNPLINDFQLDADETASALNISEGGLGDVATNPSIDFSINTIGGQSRLDFIMSLLETTSSFQTLSAPKILTVANPIDPPQIFVGQQIPFADNVDFEDQGDDDPTNNRLTADFQVAFAGVQLAFIPFILNDNHVYLELLPQITEAGDRLPVTLTGEAPAGQALPNIGPLTFNQKFVKTSVRIKDGSTLVIGGLIEERENENQNRTPFLSQIPFLGTFFTDRNIEKTKISTIMFITVKIVEPEYD